jgi:hypothetical protein
MLAAMALVIPSLCEAGKNKNNDTANGNGPSPAAPAPAPPPQNWKTSTFPQAQPKEPAVVQPSPRNAAPPPPSAAPPAQNLQQGGSRKGLGSK